MRRYRVFQALSITVMVAGLVAAAVLCTGIIRRESRELQRTSENEARHVASRMQASMLTNLERLEGLAGWWLSQGKPASVDDWRVDAQLFLTKSIGLRQALWVGADGIQYWAAKPGANPTLQHVKPDARVQQLMKADAHGMAVSEIFDEPGIGPAFYACFPVSAERRKRGYVLGLYDARTLLGALAKNEVRPEHRIAIEQSGRMAYSTLPERAGGGTRNIAAAAFELGRRTWDLKLSVPMNYFRDFRDYILGFGAVVGALVYSFGLLLYLSQRRSLALHRAYGEVHELNRDLHRKIADFQTLLDVSPIGFAVADDPECRSIRANPALAKMLGVTPWINISKSEPSAEHGPWKMMRDGRELAPEEMPMQMAAATGLPLLGEEAQLVRGDGKTIDILSFATPLFDESGRVRGVLDACVDVSDARAQEEVRRQLEQDLQRAQRMKSLGAMAAGIAHDFNNALTSVIGHASLAADQLPADSKARRHVVDSLEAANQVAKLVRQVMAYTGRAFQTLRATDLGELIAELHPELTMLAAPKAEVRLSIAPELPRVMAAQDEVRQMLCNLVLNAAEAAVGEQGAIEIAVDVCRIQGTERNLAAGVELPAGAYVRIQVKDNGPGMAPDIAEHAFDPFFSTKFLGRGLGLAEVFGIMRAHKGAVRLDSEPGEGTSVTLLFPASEKSATRAA